LRLRAIGTVICPLRVTSTSSMVQLQPSSSTLQQVQLNYYCCSRPILKLKAESPLNKSHFFPSIIFNPCLDIFNQVAATATMT
jgi:hypothetical protein